MTVPEIQAKGSVTGYAWYDTWPEKLIKTAYPGWLKRVSAN